MKGCGGCFHENDDRTSYPCRRCLDGNRWSPKVGTDLEAARQLRIELAAVIAERDRYKAALEKIAKERIPHPTPCRETYLRSVAKDALTVDEVRP